MFAILFAFGGLIRERKGGERFYSVSVFQSAGDAGYTQAVSSNKRAAQSKVVRMMIPGVGQKAGETDPQKAQVGA